MTLKEIYHIKLGPLPSLWKHHDGPIVTDYKIACMDDTDVQGPPTLDNVTTAFPNRIYLGLQKYKFMSFPHPIGRFPSSHSLWYYHNSRSR